MCHLTPLKSNNNLYLITMRQELTRAVYLGVKVISINTAGKLNLLYVNDLLFLFCFLLTLITLITVLTVIHDSAYGRICLCRYKYKVETCIIGHIKRLIERNESELLVVCADDTDCLGAFEIDLFVDKKLL